MRFCFILAGVTILALATALSGIAASPGLKATSVVRVDSRNGRLVRKVIVPSLRVNASNGSRQSMAKALRDAARVDQLVEAAGRKYNVDPLLIHSVIEVESNYNPFAVSIKGAEGLMQLIPTTARRFGVNNAFDPEQNIDAGVRYLKHLQGLFQDDRLALAAYNAGEGAVAKYRRIPPYRETQKYVTRVGAKYAELKRKAEKDTVSSSLTGAESNYRSVESFVDSQGRLHLRTR